MIDARPLVWAATVGCVAPPEGHHHEGPLYTPPELPICAPASTSTSVVACPTEAMGPVPGPHRGIESFYVLREDRPEDAWQGSTTAYYRVWWDELEPDRGAPRFDVLDDLVARAADQGQTVALRVMPFEGGRARVPDWLRDAAGARWSGDDADPAYLDAVRATSAALGARYDGVFESFDVGFVGSAGEWAESAPDGGPVPDDAARAVIDAVVAAFPTTPVVMNVGAVDDGGRPLAWALERGAGWRADCWGDLRSGGWNHHDDFYDARLDEVDADDAWRSAPVVLETCGDPAVWRRVGYDLDQVRWVLAWALARHASRVNLKSSDVPDDWRPAFEEFLVSLGHRLVAHEVAATRSGDTLAVEVRVANRGVAPFYAPARLVARARFGEDVVASAVSDELLDDLTDATVVGLTLDAPAGAAVDVALVGLDGAFVASLAQDGLRDDGWALVLDAAP